MIHLEVEKLNSQAWVMYDPYAWWNARRTSSRSLTRSLTGISKDHVDIVVPSTSLEPLPAQSRRSPLTEIVTKLLRRIPAVVLGCIAVMFPAARMQSSSA